MAEDKRRRMEEALSGDLDVGELVLLGAHLVDHHTLPVPPHDGLGRARGDLHPGIGQISQAQVQEFVKSQVKQKLKNFH